jgi:proline iminopeptidase
LKSQKIVRVYYEELDGGKTMKDGYIKVTGGQVYYKKVGSGSGIPLILLHGGPGGSHNGFNRLEALGNDRPVIFYDQLGSGKSDRPTDSSLWTVERFIEELSQIREALGLDQVHILGHSWGTMLAASYMLTQPEGVQSVTFSSPCLSAPQWAADQKKNLKELPLEVRETLDRCEREGSTDSEEYKTAMKAFNERFVCRLKEIPQNCKPDKGAFNDVVYETMWGPSEFYTTGLLKTYDVTEELHQIKCPTLFTCGRFDEATPETTKGYSQKVEGSQFHVFENSAHMGYVEEPDTYIKVIGEFLHFNEFTSAKR